MSEHDSKPPQRRIIIPPSATPQVVSNAGMALEATAPTLIQDALFIIQNEMVKFKGKSSKNILTDSDHRIIQGYLKTLTDIERGIREREADMDLSGKSDDELLQLAQTLVKKKGKK